MDVGSMEAVCFPSQLCIIVFRAVADVSYKNIISPINYLAYLRRAGCGFFTNSSGESAR